LARGLLPTGGAVAAPFLQALYEAFIAQLLADARPALRGGRERVAGALPRGLGPGWLAPGSGGPSPQVDLGCPVAAPARVSAGPLRSLLRPPAPDRVLRRCGPERTASGAGAAGADPAGDAARGGSPLRLRDLHRGALAAPTVGGMPTDPAGESAAGETAAARPPGRGDAYRAPRGGRLGPNRPAPTDAAHPLAGAARSAGSADGRPGAGAAAGGGGAGLLPPPLAGGALVL